MGLLLLYFPSLGLAQRGNLRAPEPELWLLAGIGGSGVYGGTVSYVLGVSTIQNFQTLSVRGVYNTEVVSFSSTKEKVWDLGLLYGVIAKGRYGFASLSVGVALVGGDHHVRNDEEGFLTLGVPIEIKLFGTRFPELGMGGLYFFADINPEESFAGAALSITGGE